MHTNEISRVVAESVERALDGRITPETVKAVSDLMGREISNWRARLEYARHTGRIAHIRELEESEALRRKAA